MRDLRSFDVEADWAGISPAARLVWGSLGSAALGTVGLAAAAGLATLGLPAAATGAAVVSVLAIGGWWWVVGRRQRAWGFARRGGDLLVRRGLLVQRLTVVPYGRIQFVDLKQGPLGRRLGLADVQLHTAAAATDATIPMLPEAEARRLADGLGAMGEAEGAGL